MPGTDPCHGLTGHGLNAGIDGRLPDPREARELEAWDRQHVWHAFTQMEEYQPLLIEAGQGATLTDADGRQYLDGSASLWCNIHGHRHPRLDAAAIAQLGLIAHTTNLGLSNSTSVRFAKALTEVAPPGLDKVFFSSDGSSAVEAALKLALQFWAQQGGASPQLVPSDASLPQRTRYIALDGAYHGDTLGAVGVGGVPRFGSLFAPLTFQALRIPSPWTPRSSGLGSEAALARSLEQLENVLTSHAGEIAAMIVEPLMQAAAGMLVHPPGFLRAVRDITRRHDVLLIADEVAVGFGRTGTLFACEQEGVVPDFLCLGKGITGGYLPLAATLTTQRVWDAFLGAHAELRTFFHGHSYGGNPLAAAVGLESLAVFRDERVLERMPEKIARLRERLEEISDLAHVGEVRQCGLMAGIQLVADKATGRSYPWQEKRGARACLAARKHGAMLRQLGDVVVILPPLCITPDQIDRLAHAARAGIEEVTAGEQQA